jgi:ABC-type branched-subunit amino acid transport system substrate-binding protein
VTPPPPMDVHGVIQNGIKFSMVILFSGPVKDIGRQLKQGIEAAFARVKESGGVDGRMLKFASADDGYEPTRSLDAMKQQFE